MSFPDKLRASWQLFCLSLQVLQKNPKLYLFPVVSTLSAFAILLFFFAPVLLVVLASFWGFSALAPHPDWNALAAKYNAAMYLYGALLYLVSMFVGTFMNVAFYNEILGALAGEPVSVRHGLRFALGRLPAILMWSLLAATVGLIIRAIEERLGWVGKIVMAFIGTAWSVAAVFAIPVLIRRTDSNPLAVVRDSVATLKRTWGESLAGFVGLRLGGLLFVLFSIGLLVPAILFAVVLHQFWIGFAAGVLWFVALLVSSFFINMATHVYRCALYVYASEGVVPLPYSADMMNAAWKIKKA